jgi:hypothetical protein
MAYRTVKPIVTKESDGPMSGEYYNHPAFGVVEVTRSQIGGGGIELFNSALRHNTCINIRVFNAQLHRNLHHDRVTRANRDTICEFSLSEAQWAHLVASQGISEGTPVTFKYKPAEGYQLSDVPGIQSEEKMKETFTREIREKAAKDIKEAKDITADLGKLIEEGKLGKTQLREILGRLQVFSGNFSSNMAFTQEQFAEAMEKTIEAGKSEIEAHVTNTAMRLGIQELREQFPQLQVDKKDDTL